MALRNFLERFIQRAPESAEEIGPLLEAQAKKELDPHLHDLLLEIDDLLDDFFEVGFSRNIASPIPYGLWEDAQILCQIQYILNKKTYLEVIPPLVAVRKIIAGYLPPDHNSRQAIKTQMEKILEVLNRLNSYLAEKKLDGGLVELTATWKKIFAETYHKHFFEGNSVTDGSEQLRT